MEQQGCTEFFHFPYICQFRVREMFSIFFNRNGVTLNLLIVVWITSNVHLDNRPDQCCSLHINYRRLKYAQSATYHAEYLHVQVLINYANNTDTSSPDNEKKINNK